jgi:hypothetical protein
MAHNEYPLEDICYVHRKKTGNIVKTFLASGLEVYKPEEEFKNCTKISVSAHQN